MSVSELTEGLKKKVASLGIVNPSVTACAVPAPRSGSLSKNGFHRMRKHAQGRKISSSLPSSLKKPRQIAA